MKHLLLILALLNLSAAYAADTLRVLFIGNSYTYTNNMPQLVKDLTHSGDYLIYESYTPGGYTFQSHFFDPTTLTLIAKGHLGLRGITGAKPVAQLSQMQRWKQWYIPMRISWTALLKRLIHAPKPYFI